tara:strand:+ start:201 stop:1103 length:903 start_codon:yes stop_codon:yes gene_type:complete
MIELNLPIIKQFDNGNVLVFNSENNEKVSLDTGYLHTLYGNNGTGKTTLMNILSLLTNCLYGASFDNSILKFDNTNENKNINNTSIRENYLSFIFQDAHIINIYTVEENLKIVNDSFKYEDDLELIINKSKNLNIEKESSDYLITKLNKFISEKHNTPYYLSGGEKQLLSFIRSMIKPSNIIFADEPWASMDNHLKGFIESQLYLYLSDKDIFSEIRNRNNKLSQKKVVVVISHPSQKKIGQKEFGKKDETWKYQLPVFNNFFKNKLSKEDLKSWALNQFDQKKDTNLQVLTVERYISNE